MKQYKKFGKVWGKFKEIFKKNKKKKKKKTGIFRKKFR